MIKNLSRKDCGNRLLDFFENRDGDFHGKRFQVKYLKHSLNIQENKSLVSQTIVKVLKSFVAKMALFRYTPYVFS